MKNDYQNRLEQFLNEIGESPSSLEDKCSLGRSTINRVVAGDTKRLSGNTIDKITAHYNWLSVEWLSTGKGSMRLGTFNNLNELEKNSVFIEIKKERDEFMLKYYSILEKYNACLEGRISVLASRR